MVISEYYYIEGGTLCMTSREKLSETKKNFIYSQRKAL